jgi:hypothetical protein
MDEPTKSRVWQLLGAGLDCPAVAKSLGMGVWLVRGLEAETGGVRPRPRRRSERVLSLEEREEISRGLAEGVSLTDIAVRLGRGTLDDLAGSRPQRRAGQLPGLQGRWAGLAMCSPVETREARDMPEAGPRGGAALRTARVLSDRHEAPHRAAVCLPPAHRWR